MIPISQNMWGGPWSTPDEVRKNIAEQIQLWATRRFMLRQVSSPSYFTRGAPKTRLRDANGFDTG